MSDHIGNTDQSSPEISPVTEPSTPYSSKRYRNYVLGILTLTYAFNFVDRQLISILQESIKLDLGLSDTQLGLLTGFGFAVFYVTAGLPIARWSDRSNRRNIITLAIGIWSAMTALSGLCMNFWQLLLARIGVGVGEAGGSPPAHSMISDIFPSEQRGTAMSIYSLGINFGIMFGFFLGGILNESLGWRWAFVVVGLPGVLLALWVRTTIAEPIRGWSDTGEHVSQTVPFKQVLSKLLGSKVLFHLFMGSGLYALAGYGAANWIAPFFIRTHGLGTGELGLWLSVAIGIGGGVGTFLSGYIADRLGKRDRRWYMWIPGISALVVVPLLLLVLTAADAQTALYLNLLPNLLMVAYIGPTLAILHSSIDANMRATASAIFYLVMNVIGLGIGPTLIGATSDVLATTQGSESLRWALIAIIPTALLWASAHFFVAAKHAK